MSSKITITDDRIVSKVTNNGEEIKCIQNGDSINFESNKQFKVQCEFDSNLSLIEALQNEQNQLLQKLAKIRQEDNYGTYKNIVMALSEVTRLIEKESWKDMYSHYQLKDSNGEFQEVVSTWRQKGEDIRNHHIYKIDGEIPTVKIKIDKENMIETDYELTVPLIIDDKLKHEIKLKKENGKIICL